MVKINKSVSARIVIISLFLTFAICTIDNNASTLEKEYVETQTTEVIEEQVQSGVITPVPTTTVKRPIVLPSVPSATPATVVTKPAVAPVAQKSGPSCKAGFHWAWTNPKIRSGMCVKDYENNCEEYEYTNGVCNKCFPGFIKTKTQYSDYFCLKEGGTMPDLKTLREADPAYNRLHRGDSMTWFIWLIIIVAVFVVIAIVIVCIRKRRAAQNISKLDSKFKDLDAAEYYDMGEPRSPF